MNRINVESEAVQITVNNAGDTIILNVQDQRFMHTVTALVSEFTENAQTYKAKCEEIAAMPHDTTEEKFAQLTAVAAVSNEICSMLKEKVDNVCAWLNNRIVYNHATKKTEFVTLGYTSKGEILEDFRKMLQFDFKK